MPEGDTIYRAARRLHAALASTVLTEADLRVPRLATADLRGWTCAAVEPRGKHLLIRLTTPGGSEGSTGPDRPDASDRPAASDRLTLHTHLGMDGNWAVGPAGGRPPDDHRIRVVLANTRHRCLGRLLKQVELWPTAEEDRHLGHLGPDVLGPDWDPAEAARRLTADPAVPVGVALLDQRNLAGLGNVYRNELCFLRGVLPSRPIGDMDSIDRLVQLSHDTLHANRNRPGRVFTGDPRPGRETWVYGRAGRPCRRCGTPIRRGTLGAGPGATPEDRLTFYCPRCQR